MNRKRRNGARIFQHLARLGSGLLFVGAVTVGGLALAGYTYPSLAASPSPTTARSYIQLNNKTPSHTSGVTPTKPTAVTAVNPATPVATSIPAPTATPEQPYDYSKPVPEREAVETAWFSDAAFVGDSRTEGLVLYSKIKPGGSFAYRGLNVQTARTDKVVKDLNGNKATAIDALKRGTYQKVYLSLGINELGWYNNKRYETNYADLIDLVRAAQPNAQIYLQTIIPVTAAKSATSYINNPQILVYNSIITQLAEEKEVYLVDVWSAFADKSGALSTKGSSDGVHLTKEYYGKWLDYLKTHTVATEDGSL